MSSEAQPQPGDKVRVTSIVDKNGRYGGIMSVEDGLFGATLEIVERADDPSRDEVGTIRGDRFVKLTRDNGCDWWDLKRQMWTNIGVQAEPVTGAVPGTPAAQAQQKCPHCEYPGQYHAPGDNHPIDARGVVGP